MLTEIKQTQKVYITCFLSCRIKTCMYVCVCTHVYICVCLCVCTYACINVYLCVHMYVWLCVHMCVYVHVGVYICMCTYVCVYVCVGHESRSESVRGRKDQRKREREKEEDDGKRVAGTQREEMFEVWRGPERSTEGGWSSWGTNQNKV